MKGIIFNLLEAVVTKESGANTWDDLLDAAELECAYTSLGNYPDADLFKLVGAAAAALKLPPEVIVKWFGKQMLPRLVGHYPQLFTPHKTSRAFILTLNNVIHPEVRKLYPGADTPDFDFDASSPDVLVMDYRSKRKLCALAEGLVEGRPSISARRCISTIRTACCAARRNAGWSYASRPSPWADERAHPASPGRKRAPAPAAGAGAQGAAGGGGHAEHGLRVLFERQRQLELMQAVATAANAAVTTEAALQTVLKLLCEFTGGAVAFVHRLIERGVRGPKFDCLHLGFELHDSHPATGGDRNGER